ncbi:MAG: alpha/beta fold hydrolase [Phycisphaerales bacterium]|nr:alpha/beta fold hydrolase [Phycisphaerales bacterium]
MRQTKAHIASITCLVGVTGCGVIPSPEDVSRLFLYPDYTCTEIADELGVPAPFEPVDPGDIGLAFGDFSVTSANGATINGWYIPPPANTDGFVEPRGAVILLHGNVGSRACSLPWVSAITSNGFAAVTFDYQGFGDSAGTPNLATLYQDSSAVLDWTLAHAAAAGTPVHLLGVSLGTAPAAGLALNRPADVATVALDSPFDPLARIRSAAYHYGVPPFLVEYYARIEFSWLFATRDRLSEIATPAIFLIGAEDTSSPPADAQSLFNAWGSTDKSYWTFADLSHVQAVFYATSEYETLLNEIWSSSLAN